MKTLPDFTSQLRELISLPSVSSCSPQFDQSNLAVIERLASWFETLGFSCEIQTVDEANGKANLVATLGSGPGGLVLAGHTDTVPFNAEKWQSDPFALVEKNQRFYGLGTCDMKGFFAVVLQAVQQYRAKDFKQPLIVLATADEESSMQGARHLAECGAPLGRYAIVGEPTSLKPIYMHKGIMMERIRISGSAGHSSNPSLGVNAIDAMQHVLTDLLKYRGELQQQHNNPAFEVAFPTLNLGCIHGGDNPNRICNSCELHFDLRGLPGMQNDELRAQIDERLLKVQQQFDVGIEFSPLISGVSPFEQDISSDIVQMAQKLTGHSAQAVAFATEAPFLQQLGMETIVLGPGSIDQAHQPDEYIEMSQIDPCVKLLQEFIEAFCLRSAIAT